MFVYMYLYPYAETTHVKETGERMDFRNTKAKRIAACIIAGILVLAMIAPLLAAMS